MLTWFYSLFSWCFQGFFFFFFFGNTSTFYLHTHTQKMFWHFLFLPPPSVIYVSRLFSCNWNVIVLHILEIDEKYIKKFLIIFKCVPRRNLFHTHILYQRPLGHPKISNFPPNQTRPKPGSGNVFDNIFGSGRIEVLFTWVSNFSFYGFWG